MASRQLRAQVALPLVRSSNVVAKQGKHLAIENSTAHNFHWRNAEALLVDLPAGPHGTGIGSTDIGGVSASGNEEIRNESSARAAQGSGAARTLGPFGG